MNNTNISWKDIGSLCPSAMSILKVLLIIAVLDLAISVSLSFFINDSFYYKKFMASDLWEEKSHYEEITSEYFNNKHNLRPNTEAGWVNTPNYHKDHLKWSTDFLGSRVSPQQVKINYPPEIKNDENLVFLIGSSVLSGYNLEYEKAPVSYLNNAGYKALSFGTIHYSIDQTFAFYKNVLSEYKPKILIVGIHNDPEVISNMFLPFRIHDTSAPFLKPAYYLRDNALVKIQPPVDHQKRQESTEMISELKKHDTHYYKFQIYKRLSLLPFSDLVRKAVLKIEKRMLDIDEYTKAFELQKYFMEEIVGLAKESGAKVIFVKIEAQEDQEKPFYKRFYKDKNEIHTRLLKETGMNVIYTSEMFKETGRPLSDFYQGHDTVHFSADACELLAKKVDQAIKDLTTKTTY